MPANPIWTTRPRSVQEPDTVDVTDSFRPVDPVMVRAVATARRAALSLEPVLLQGETGVGKDVLARIIHSTSPRSNGSFVQVNCASVTETLLEAELFGHVRGAYTGAVDSRPGQFEMAQGGTLFLDEIGELGPRQQAKLLHVLQEKAYRRVGSRETIATDARVIAATNVDIETELQEGRFRRDLFYRLGVVCIRVPSLKERPADIGGLARFFAHRYAGSYGQPGMASVPGIVLETLGTLPFEGNVRELENLVKRSLLMGSWNEILSQAGEPDEPLEEPFFAERSRDLPLKEVTRNAVERAERTAIRDALEKTGWNRKRAADLLQISYRGLLYKLRAYRLVPQGEACPELELGVLGPREGTC